MNIRIGENIRQLRRRDGRTQEDLSEALGVSPQAVSRWELNSGYPDMELIPTIANYFHVAIDELFGYRDNREEKIQKIIENADDLLKPTGMTLGKGRLSPEVCEGIEALKRAADEFPNEPRILVRLGEALHKLGWHEYGGFVKYEDGMLVDDPERNSKNLRWQEALRIYERLLKSDPSPDEREAASVGMVYLYGRMGEYEKAREIVNSQSPMQNCREMLMPHTARGGEQVRYMGERVIKLLQWIYLSLSDSIFAVRDITKSDYAVKIRLAVLNLYESVFSDDRFGFCHYYAAGLYRDLSNYEAENGNIEKALEYFDNEFENVRAYCGYLSDEEYVYTAPIVAGIRKHNPDFTPLSKDYWKMIIEKMPESLREEVRKDEKYAECFEW